MFVVFGILVLCFTGSFAQYLEVSGQDLTYKGEKVFLSGMNIAWEAFGYDFGNDQYQNQGPALEDYLRRIAAAGGNSVRIWIHTDGRDTPNFNGDGHAISADRTGSFINDLSRYLDVAQENNILVTLVLWNGATMPLARLIEMMYDDAKLDSYINNVLVPTVRALKSKHALAAWEVINEPEGSLDVNAPNSDPCFDGRALQGTGAGWAGPNIPVDVMLRFIARQNAAIKNEDPKALTTIGSWSERSQTDQFGWRNYYTDECMRKAAGGDNGGIIDFYQMHTYSFDGAFSDSSPMLHENSAYEVDKPNVLGEYSQDGADGRDIETMQAWAYEKGYSGGWTWQANGGGFHSDDFDTQARGLGSIAGRSDFGKIQLDLS